MTVITKPLSQERKEEKLDKELLTGEGGNVDLVIMPGGNGAIVLTEDSTSISVETSDYDQGDRTSTKAPSRILVLSQLCLLGTAIFGITIGLSVAMHSYYKIGHHRQFYKGFCRIPYPSTLSDLNNHRGSLNQVGLGIGLHGDSTVITGDFVQDTTKVMTKEQEMKRIMEKLVQKAVAPLDNDKNKNMLPPRDGGPLLDGLLNRKVVPKVTMKEKQTLLPDGKFELDYDLDFDFDREELQMPELSHGKYLHDFKMNKTAIIDNIENRCFVLSLNRQDIAPPRTLYDIIRGMSEGAFDIDIEEIRQDMKIVYPAVDNFGEYGPVIKHACKGKKTYRLQPVDKMVDKAEWHSLVKRSADEKLGKEKFQYQEFAGKFIKYNIINMN